MCNKDGRAWLKRGSLSFINVAFVGFPSVSKIILILDSSTLTSTHIASVFNKNGDDVDFLSTHQKPIITGS